MKLLHIRYPVLFNINRGIDYLNPFGLNHNLNDFETKQFNDLKVLKVNYEHVAFGFCLQYLYLNFSSLSEFCKS